MEKTLLVISIIILNVAVFLSGVQIKELKKRIDKLERERE